jgi:hypothetical protein
VEIGVRLARHQTFCAALLLVLALHLCFFPFIWGDKTLLAGSRGGVTSIMPDGAFYGGSQGPSIYRGNDMGASSWMTEAGAPLVRHQYIAERNLPLWNPYQAYGAPLAANMQSQPLARSSFCSRCDPGPAHFNFFILCRFLLRACARIFICAFSCLLSPR